MRPRRLVLEGFWSYRERTEVDFGDTDLFALTGATGAGKSTLIDALVFALYGSIPRLDRRAVAPIISLGRNEAKVLLEFTVGGVDYTALRVVRRTKTGATTKEARLESGGLVLAGNEKELTAEVTRLLGLKYEHFTTCVVLPQGEFMRLLHEEPSKRQDLLISLLDLGLYERMARIARGRANDAAADQRLADQLLAKLAFATPDALAAATARADALVALRHEVDAALDELAVLRDAAAAAEAEATTARDQLRLLDRIEPPRDLGDHAAALAEAREAVAAAEAAATEAAAALDLAAERRVALPERAELEAATRAHGSLATRRAEQAEAEAALAAADPVLAAAEAEATAAHAALVEADADLERARWEHRAHDLATSLVPGEPCPVCHQVVAELWPAGEGGGDRTAAAAEAKDVATQRSATAADALRRAVRARDRAAAGVEQAQKLVAELEVQVAAHPDAEALAVALAATTEAEGAERSAQAHARRTGAAVAQARAVLDDLAGRETAAWRAFDQARDRVAPLGPPAPSRTDLAADWAALAEWVGTVRPERQARAEDAARRAAEATEGLRRRQQELVRRAAEVGVERQGKADLRSAIADAVARTEAERDRIAAGLAEVAEREAERAEAGRRADRYGELARLLNASHFEKWVLDEVLAVLLDGATEVLHELTGDAYSLALDDRGNFLVVDHRNADEARLVTTLSGGETFLASLALALALADHIGSFAADGAARLESIFLDEGFGTLDAETLDAVASAIEELGARGRMVGLVSHVPDLAERVPVRFEVTKVAGASSVTKVVA